MTKDELVSKISQNAGITVNMANDFLSLFNDIVLENFANNDKLTIVGFGTFSADTRAEINGKDLKTLEPIALTERIVPKFKGGKDFLSKVPNEK